MYIYICYNPWNFKESDTTEHTHTRTYIHTHVYIHTYTHGHIYAHIYLKCVCKHLIYRKQKTRTG